MKLKEAFPKGTEAEKKQDADKQENLSYQFQIDDAKKKDICKIVKEYLEQSERSRTGWLQLRRESIDQYEGVKAPSNEPWEGHSNISTMVTTVACDLLHSKIFPMVWNPRTLEWEGTESHDNETASVNKTVMNYVAGTDMKLQDKVDDICHRLIVDGTIAIKLLWKPYYKWVTRKDAEITPEAIANGKLEYKVSYDYVRDERCEIDVRDIERVFIPSYGETTDPRWEDGAEYILDERWWSLAELKEMQLDGLIDDKIDLDKLAYTGEVPQMPGTQQARSQAEGTTITLSELPQSFKHRCIEAYIKYDINNDKRREECVFIIMPDSEIYLSGKALHHVSRIGRRPWIIRPFLRRPGRTLGKSVPELVRHLHKELDAIHNQRIDAGNRVIGGGGFYRPASGTNPRRIKMGPATWVPVDDPQKDIYQPTYNMSGLAWSANEERLVMELIERLTYLTPAMLGRETASRPTARGTLAVIQQGEAKFGLIGARVQKIVCDLLTDIRQKYEENMPPAKWERIIGKKMLREWPSPEYMAGSYDAKMQLDLTASDPEAERAIASLMYQTMAMDPLVMQNPAFMWEVRADYLRAHRREPVEKYIGPRPPATSDPKDADDVFTMIEQEQRPPLEGDPATLLPTLIELKNSDRYAKFTPQAKAIFNDFIRKLKMGYMDRIIANAQIGGVNAGQNAGMSPGLQNAPGLRNLSPQIPGAIPGATGGPAPVSVEGQ